MKNDLVASNNHGRGSEKNIRQFQPKVYAVTHASALDIPVLYVYLPFQFPHHFQE